MNKVNIAQYTVKAYEEDNKFYGKLINNNATGFIKVPKKYYRFSSMELAQEWLEDQVESIKSWEKTKKDRKAERMAFVNPAKIGDILYSSWGYDQTNIDFYKVTKKTKRTVTIVEIGKKFVGSEPGQDLVMAGSVVKGGEMKKLVKASGSNGYYVSVSCSVASLWNGEAKHQTDAYSGH